jgi:hypothetical protein
MNTKRGLGRGLEVLLTDVAASEPTQKREIEEQVIIAKSLIKLIQKEHQQLLHEAEDLKCMLEDLEASFRL